MPSKVALKQQVEDLTKKLREVTETIHMSGKMVEIPLTPEGKAVEHENNPNPKCPQCGSYNVKPSDFRGYLKCQDCGQYFPEPKKGNPIACATALSKQESDIASGKTYWDIIDEQFKREEDTCLPCEISYTEIKDALTRIGASYTILPEPEKWIKVADIAAQVREQTAREIFKATQERKRLETNCDIKLTRVASRLKKMEPLAHIGRWDELLEQRNQLLSDFESDIKDIIPDIEIRIPSYAVPRVIIPSEYEMIKAGLTEEERLRLKEREARLKLETGTPPAKWAAYNCPYCDLRFPTIVRMHEHVAMTHPLYKCPYCEKELWTLEKRLEHIKSEHPEKIK